MRFFYFVFLLAACAGCATQDSAAGSTSDALADMASDGALADVGPGDVEILEDALAQDVEIPEVSFDVNLDWSWSPSDSFGGQDSQDVEEPKVDLEPLREAFFALENAHLVEITLSAGGVMALDEEPYEYVKGDVHVDGEPFPGIGVRLKGKYGSFRTLDEKAAFLLNFA